MPKKGGGLDCLLIYRGLGKKEGGGVFERGVEIPMHTRYIYDGEYDFLIRIPIKN